MGKSRKTRAAAARTADNGRAFAPKRRDGNLHITQEAIDRHWIPFPPGAKEFILEPPRGKFDPLRSMVKFWSSPQNIESTRGRRGSCITRAAWYMALLYEKLGMPREARSLTINGAFIHQCINSSIEYIVSLCEGDGPAPPHKLPYFCRGVDSIRSSEAMESFIRTYLPPEDTQMMTSYANMSDQNYVRGYVDQISDDWNGSASSPKKGRRQSLPTDNETRIELILVDDSDKGNRHSFDTGSSTTLKALFNDYADKRGVSLRSLRFSYMGKTMFLSSAGCKTPTELGMRDHDVIVVHDTTRSSPDDDDRPSQKSPTPKKTKAKKKSNKKAKRKSKRPQQQAKPDKTLEEYKVEHSKQLTKIHGEAQDQFKQIRQRLNNLSIQRRQPKIKSKCTRLHKKEQSVPSLSNNPFNEGLGGKAGKSRFAIQVGEVKNLYKTAKSSAIASNNCPSSSTELALDLHGCTRDEALVKLDDTLKVWVNTAMRGSYPFVVPATIICGCGNQILSEAVQEWIRSNDKVSNAPKVRSSKR